MNFFVKKTRLIPVILVLIGTVYAPVYSPGVAERIIKNALVEVKKTGTIKDVAQFKQAYQDLPRMTKENYQEDYFDVIEVVEKEAREKKQKQKQKEEEKLKIGLEEVKRQEEEKQQLQNKERLEKENLEKEKIKHQRDNCKDLKSVIMHNTTDNDLQVRVFSYSGSNELSLLRVSEFNPQDISAKSYAVVCVPKASVEFPLIVSPKDTFLHKYNSDEYGALKLMGRLFAVNYQNVDKDNPNVIEINPLKKTYEYAASSFKENNFTTEFKGLLEKLNVVVTDPKKKLSN